MSFPRHNKSRVYLLTSGFVTLLRIIPTTMALKLKKITETLEDFYLICLCMFFE